MGAPTLYVKRRAGAAVAALAVTAMKCWPSYGGRARTADRARPVLRLLLLLASASKADVDSLLGPPGWWVLLLDRAFYLRRVQTVISRRDTPPLVIRPPSTSSSVFPRWLRTGVAAPSRTAAHLMMWAMLRRTTNRRSYPQVTWSPSELPLVAGQGR